MPVNKGQLIKLGIRAQPDVIPDAFNFTPVTGVAASTTVDSNTITVTGISFGVSLTVTVAGGTYSKNGGAFTGAAGTATLNDTFQLRLTSSATPDGQVSAVLNIGTISGSFDVTTENPSFDHIVNSYAELVSLLRDNSPVVAPGDRVLVAADCVGAQFTITNKSWAGVTIQGSSAATMPVMPRMVFNNVDGGVGSPITWKWLNVYNVCTDSAQNGEGQITFLTNESRYHRWTECKIHDADFSTKAFPWQGSGVSLAMFRGINCSGNGTISDLELDNCEIYNQYRSFISGNNVSLHDNRWHDHYIHAATIEGDDWLIEDDWCWNLFAGQTDTGSPHAGNSFSPSPDSIGDTTNGTIRRVVAIPGIGRRTLAIAQGKPEAIWNPIASGIKYNDMFATGFHNVNIAIEDCLLVGTDTMMVEIDAPGGTRPNNCKIRGCTFVHDLDLNGTNNPTIYSTHGANDGVDIYDNITFSLSTDDALADRVVTCWNNASADPDAPLADATDLISYSSVFTGPSFALLETPEDAIAAFTLNPAHPCASWANTPGYLGNGSRVYSTRPTTNTATAQGFETVTKAADVASRANPPGSNVPWIATNLKKFSIIIRCTNDVSIDRISGRVMLDFSGDKFRVERLASGNGTTIPYTSHWRLSSETAAGPDNVFANGTYSTLAADGICTIIFTYDIAQAKLQTMLLNGGVVYSDVPTVTGFTNANTSINDTVSITAGDSAVTTVPSAGGTWVGNIDLIAMTDQFMDLSNPTIYDALINTSGELADLGAAGVNIGLGTWPIWLQGPASAWNGTTFNDGNGTGTGGAATQFAKQGAGAFVDA